MNLDAAERFLSKLPIRDRDSHARVPFNFKFNQKKLHIKAAEQVAAGKPIRLIVDKARRVTCSSWTEGLLFCHNIALPGSQSLIVGHEYKTSKALFQVPKTFVEGVPFLNIRSVEREMRFPFPGKTDSLMQILTAGKDTSGRGFTLSGLHLSEVAHYISPDALVSLMPALSNHKDTIGVIESTPNGKEGDGEQFYTMWMDAIENRSEYEPVFLTWTDDPACLADPELAKDAPRDDDEKELIKMGLNKSQLAWRRLRIASPECGGMVEIFNQEYPVTWQESFIASGMPAFEKEEMNWARKNIKKPIFQGFIVKREDGTMELRNHPKGTLRIWEKPIPGHYYYLGLDAARGEEGRDFSAIVGIDGTTGHQVFTYADYCIPETLGCFANSLGRHYNKAMVNGDLTGGYGSGSLHVMRDKLRYPNMYRWKGKDDKSQAGTAGKSLWMDISSHIRSMMFEMLRIALREASATDGDFGITIYDELLVNQIESCTRKESWRIDVRKGHDDILFGILIANIAMVQWAPPRPGNRSRSMRQEEDDSVRASIAKRGDVILDDANTMLRRHHAKISNLIDHPPRAEDEEIISVS